MWLCQWYIIELCPPFVSLGTLSRYRCTYTYSDQSSLARYQTDFSVTNRPATAAAAAATLWQCHNLSYRNLPATVIDPVLYRLLRKSSPVFFLHRNLYRNKPWIITNRSEIRIQYSMLNFLLILIQLKLIVILFVLYLYVYCICIVIVFICVLYL
jgi:hypothetical protein